MATETRRSRILIEDWSGVTTTNVIPDGQERWYDGVTGYQATEVIRLIGDNVTTIASLLKRQELTDSAQTLYGVKTFDSIPILPATAPTTANQAMSKTHAEALLGLPAGYIYGLETSADTDADHDVLIAVGKCRDSSDTVDIELTTAMTKQIDATWAAGDDAGGLFTGTVAADTTYHLFAILKDSDDSVDLGWDTDIDCSNIPTGYTEYRRVASFRTDSSSNIKAYSQHGNAFEFLDKTALTTITSTILNGHKQTKTLYDTEVPEGLNFRVLVNGKGRSTNATNIQVASYDDTTSATVGTTAFLQMQDVSEWATNQGMFITNTSAEVYVWNTGTLNITASAAISVTTWIDDRGQYGGK